jgi:cytochrome c553
LASSGSDDVLAIDPHTGFARWHSPNIGLEPGGLVLDSTHGRLLILTITGQEIVMLDSKTGRILSRIKAAHDPTPAPVARGRYLFGTATDKRLTKDHWMSCAVCHPEGGADGRQWDLGEGRLDTRSLGGCLQTAPLHYNGRQKAIRDTFLFTRLVMAGQWFDPPPRRHPEFDSKPAESNNDLEALAAYIAGLPFPPPPTPSPETAQLRHRGRQIFFSKEAGCVRCHPPPFYTDSGRRDREGGPLLHDVATCSPGCPVKHSRLDTPSLLGLLRSEPYLHHGQARTLEEVFTRFNPHDQHGRTSHLGKEEIRALAEFLRYLRQGAP